MVSSLKKSVKHSFPSFVIIGIYSPSLSVVLKTGTFVRALTL